MEIKLTAPVTVRQLRQILHQCNPDAIVLMNTPETWVLVNTIYQGAVCVDPDVDGYYPCDPLGNDNAIVAITFDW